MTPEQQAFLRSELWTLAWQGASQRNRIFLAGLDYADRRRQGLQASVRQRVWNLVDEKYTDPKKPVSSEDHTAYICTLADDLTREHGACLYQGRMRIGTVQKLLNLFLKYLWCAGMVPEPPHCPIDSIILRKLGLAGTLWTTLDSADGYKNIILQAKKTATENGTSLSQWELKVFSRRGGGAEAG